MDDRGYERDDSKGGLGLGGPQDGPIGGDDRNQRQGDGLEPSDGDIGEGGQRTPGSSSRDSEKLAGDESNG